MREWVSYRDAAYLREGLHTCNLACLPAHLHLDKGGGKDAKLPFKLPSVHFALIGLAFSFFLSQITFFYFVFVSIIFIGHAKLVSKKKDIHTYIHTCM